MLVVNEKVRSMHLILGPIDLGRRVQQPDDKDRREQDQDEHGADPEGEGYKLGFTVVDEMTKSISMNRLYMEQNLVVGYLAYNPINNFENQAQSLEKSDEIRRESAQFVSQHDNDTNVSPWLSMNRMISS
jgi:hypothetical protein